LIGLPARATGLAHLKRHLAPSSDCFRVGPTYLAVDDGVLPKEVVFNDYDAADRRLSLVTPSTVVWKIALIGSYLLRSGQNVRLKQGLGAYHRPDGPKEPFPSFPFKRGSR